MIGLPLKALKSSSSTFCDPSGISTDLTKTASVTALGGWLDAIFPVVGSSIIDAAQQYLEVPKPVVSEPSQKKIKIDRQ